MPAAVALIFPLFVNQGVLYYIQRFSIGSETISPWPTFTAVVVATLLGLVAVGLTLEFVVISFVALTVNVAFASTYLYSPSGEYGLYKALQTVTIPTVCVAAGYVVSRGCRHRLLLGTCAVLAAMTALVFIVNEHTPDLFEKSEKMRFGDPRSVIITYHNFSFAMSLGAVWAIYRLWRNLPRPDILAALCLLCFVYFILISGGRIGLLEIGVSMLLFLCVGSRNRGMAAATCGVLVFATVLGAIVLQSHALDLATSAETPKTLKRLVTYAFLQPEMGLQSPRDKLRGLAFEVFSQSPLLGVGWGGFPVSAGLPDRTGWWPHNIVLELLAEAGIFGASAFFALVGLLLYTFVRFRERSEDKIVILVLFCIGFAASMAGGEWPHHRVLFYAIGAMAGLPRSSDRREGPAAHS